MVHVDQADSASCLSTSNGFFPCLITSSLMIHSATSSRDGISYMMSNMALSNIARRPRAPDIRFSASFATATSASAGVSVIGAERAASRAARSASPEGEMSEEIRPLYNQGTPEIEHWRDNTEKADQSIRCSKESNGRLPKCHKEHPKEKIIDRVPFELKLNNST